MCFNQYTVTSDEREPLNCTAKITFTDEEFMRVLRRSPQYSTPLRLRCGQAEHDERHGSIGSMRRGCDGTAPFVYPKLGPSLPDVHINPERVIHVVAHSKLILAASSNGAHELYLMAGRDVECSHAPLFVNDDDEAAKLRLPSRRPYRTALLCCQHRSLGHLAVHLHASCRPPVLPPTITSTSTISVRKCGRSWFRLLSCPCRIAPWSKSRSFCTAASLDAASD